MRYFGRIREETPIVQMDKRHVTLKEMNDERMSGDSRQNMRLTDVQYFVLDYFQKSESMWRIDRYLDGIPLDQRLPSKTLEALLLRSGMTIEKARSWVDRAKAGELHKGYKMQKNGAVIAELTRDLKEASLNPEPFKIVLAIKLKKILSDQNFYCGKGKDALHVFLQSKTRKLYSVGALEKFHDDMIHLNTGTKETQRNCRKCMPILTKMPPDTSDASEAKVLSELRIQTSAAARKYPKTKEHLWIQTLVRQQEEAIDECTTTLQKAANNLQKFPVIAIREACRTLVSATDSTLQKIEEEIGRLVIASQFPPRIHRIDGNGNGDDDADGNGVAIAEDLWFW